MQLQQGDVNIVSTTTRPEKLQPILNSGVIKEGTATGHSHRLVGTVFLLYNIIGMAGTLFAEVKSADCEVVHEEHETIKLPAGDYLFRPVVEFDHFANRSRYVYD